MISNRYIFLVITFFCFTVGFSQTNNGLIPVQTFGTEDYKSQPSNWAFGESKNGAIYVGNKEALLVYTGSWRKYTIDNHNEVKSIAVSEDGKIFVGGKGEFGYFYVDDKNLGTLIYHPVYKLLDTVSITQIGDIWYLGIQDSVTYFASKKRLYTYSNNTLKYVDSPGEILFFSKVGQRYIAGIKGKGLYEPNDGELVKISGDNFLFKKGEREVLNVKQLTDFGNSKAIFVDDKNQLKTFDLNDSRFSISNFPTQLDSIFSSMGVNKILSINNTYIAIHTNGDGLYIIDYDGKFVRKIDKSTGLKQDIIEAMFLDGQNNLWLAHGSGLSRVSLFSQYQYYPPELTGLKGRVQNISRFNNKLYIATKFQLFEMDEQLSAPKTILSTEDILKQNFTKAKPVELKETLAQGCWDLLEMKIDKNKVFLLITNETIFQLKEDNSLDTAMKSSGNVLLQDPMDPHRVWVGMYPNGLGSIYYQNGKWLDEGRIPNINIDIYSLAFDQNLNLWMGCIDGAIKLAKPVFTNNIIVKPQVKKYNHLNGLPENDAITILFDGEKMIFGSSEGLYLFSEKEDKFFKSDIYPKWYQSHHVHRMLKDSRDNIWTVTYTQDHSKIFLKKLLRNSENHYLLNTPYAKEVNSQAFDALYQDGNRLWAGGSFDLVRIDNISKTDSSARIKAFINQIFINNDSLLFDGIYVNEKNEITNKQNNSLAPVIKYKYNNFTFNYSAIAQKIEGKPSYRFLLEGYDEAWGNWNSMTEVRFTNLPEGNYVFRVQAKDIYDNLSEEVSFKFTIKPPWWRTVWAYISYVLLFVGFVWGAIRVSTQSLKKIIREATAEIVAQKEDIEEKNQSIMSSIRYAQRIQEAVTPQKKLMDKVFPEHFVLWKPRDIVSGDFYWMMQKNNKAILAAADCTGHGVPGAFMSIMGISFLNEIANNKEVQTAAEALNQLRHNVITSLNQEGSETDTKDGMDISLCVYDMDNMMMQFAGAYNPLYMIRDGELSVIKADRMPIGVHERDDRPFTNMEFSMHQGDIFYILSDGYIDQFGGKDGKKFMTKKFKELILEIHHLPMAEQKEVLWEKFLEWRGDIEQVDDIIIIGIKV